MRFIVNPNARRPGRKVRSLLSTCREACGIAIAMLDDALLAFDATAPYAGNSYYLSPFDF